jgi:molybdopterin converting factor small subunit
MELAGIGNLELEIPGKPRLQDLLERLSERFGTDFKNVLAVPSDEYGHYFLSILINDRDFKKIGGLKTELKENDVIRLIPPIFGG